MVPSAGTALSLPGTHRSVELLHKLSTGGMAEIYVARLVGVAGFEKRVVVKRILPHVAHDTSFVRMFVNEACTASRITHPNVCQTFELCMIGEEYCQVMEYLDGVTITDVFRQAVLAGRAIPAGLAAGLVVQACDGLHAAHELRDDEGELAGIIHRDVSPGNLFVTVDGIVKLLDFGISKSRDLGSNTQTGVLRGKPAYMSPEQVQVRDLDRRTDLFSLGVVFHELLTGRRLFRRETDYETLGAVVNSTIPAPSAVRPELPKAVDAVVARALARDRDERYATAAAMRSALSRAMGRIPVWSSGEIAEYVRAAFAGMLAERHRAISGEVPGWLAASVLDRASPAADAPGTMRLADRQPRRAAYFAYDPPAAGSEPVSSSTGAPGAPQPDTGKLIPLPVPLARPATTPAPDAASAPAALATVSVVAPALAEPTGATVILPAAVSESIATGQTVSAGPRRPRRRALWEIAIGIGVGIAIFAVAVATANMAERAPLEGVDRVPAEPVTAIAPGAAIGSAAIAPAATIASAPGVAGPGEPPAPPAHAAVEPAEEDTAPEQPPAVTAAETRADPDATDDVRRRARRPARDDVSRPSRKPARRVEPGLLTIDSIPYATVYIDGERKDITPIVKMRLSPGVHKIRAVTADGRSSTRTVRIRRGKERTVKITDW